jgi:hypothetical protein
MPGHTKKVDIDEMIANLPRNEQVMVKMLRALIIECIPQATEKAYYDLGIPFYTRNRLICFIWPPSVVWEPGANHEKRKAKGVSLGFNQGKLMSNEDGVLLAEGRKQVYMMYFKELGDIDEAQVRALLFEAAMIDEEFVKKKKRE